MDSSTLPIITLLVSTPAGGMITLPLNIVASEVLQGGAWITTPSVVLSYESAAKIVEFTSDDLATEEFIQELIPFAFIEGQIVADEVSGVHDDKTMWAWTILLNGQSAEYAQVNEAAKAILCGPSPVGSAQQ